MKVIGEGIIPERTYLVQVVRGTAEEPVPGEAIEATTWKWGDVANSEGMPVGDGVVDLNDLSCTLDAFGNPTSCVSADQKPCGLIDGTANLDDLLVYVSAFAGETYPVTCAAAYPPACPPTTPTPPKKQPYYFTGQRLDFDLRNTTTNEPYLALYHYRARAYEPIHGRFLQRDPAEYVDGMDLYEYVRSFPSVLSDPFGTMATENDPAGGTIITIGCPANHVCTDGTACNTHMALSNSVKINCEWLARIDQAFKTDKCSCIAHCMTKNWDRAYDGNWGTVKRHVQTLKSMFCDTSNKFPIYCVTNAQDPHGWCARGTAIMYTWSSFGISERQFYVCLANMSNCSNLSQGRVWHEMLRQLGYPSPDNNGWDNMIGPGSFVDACRRKCKL